MVEHLAALFRYARLFNFTNRKYFFADQQMGRLSTRSTRLFCDPKNSATTIEQTRTWYAAISLTEITRVLLGHFFNMRL
jgi:hypothetical protein